MNIETQKPTLSDLLLLKMPFLNEVVAAIRQALHRGTGPEPIRTEAIRRNPKK